MSATKNINAEKIQGNLAITSVSATTYYGLPQDIFTTGGTYSAGTAIFNNSTGGTFSVIGFYTGANEVNYLPLSGGTMSGQLVLNADATTGLQAVTYQQFNNAILGLQIKTTATVATTAALSTNVYLSGVITITATGVLIVDSYTVQLNDYVLVKNEVLSQYNGLYKCTTAGAIGVQAVLTRATDMNSSTEFSGAFVPVGNSGTTNANSLWLANPSTPVVVGTTPIPFTQLNGATDLISGNGISITGNTISNIGVLNIGQGTNIITGGTANNPIINTSLNPVFTSVSATTISGSTIFSGSTNLSSVFALAGSGVQSVGQGTNIITGGTATNPVINTSLIPTFTSVSATTISGSTIYSGSTNLSSLFAGYYNGRIVSNVTPYISSSTATDELAMSFKIPAGTLVAGDFFETNYLTSQVNSGAGLKTWKIYINSANTLTSATQIATNGTTSSFTMFVWRNTFAVISNTSIQTSFTTSTGAPGITNDSSTATGNPPVATTIPTLANDVYILATVRRANSGDTASINWGKIQFEKQ